MRVPNEIRDCVCFLCTKEFRDGSNVYQCKGTGFFVAVPSETHADQAHVYLVTARHNVERARDAGSLYLRLNTVTGEADYVEAKGEWLFPESDSSDVAVMMLDIPFDEFQFQPVPVEILATQSSINRHDIGIGDEIIITGLFSQRHGTRRNSPIVRTGIIASMPDEPLKDEQSGLEYEAYLVEVRSIGGLSGSPVFIFVQVAGTLKPMRGAPLIWTHQIFVLGLIRGHWDYKRTVTEIGYTDDEATAVNMGMAIVTPIQEVINILYSDECVRERRKIDREFVHQNSKTH